MPVRFIKNLVATCRKDPLVDVTIEYYLALIVLSMMLPAAVVSLLPDGLGTLFQLYCSILGVLTGGAA